MDLLLLKIKSGKKTKAATYHPLASRNFSESSQLVENGTVTRIHARYKISKKIKGCFTFDTTLDGYITQYVMNKNAANHISGSSGKSVARDSLKLYSTDHGRQKMSSKKINCHCCHPKYSNSSMNGRAANQYNELMVAAKMLARKIPDKKIKSRLEVYVVPLITF